VERNARAQNQLIDDLLDVSSIISGKLRLDVRSVALGAVIEAALETVRLSAEAKNVRLQVVLDPAAGPVKGDPDRLQQVVWNLFSNAIKFTPKGGRVDIHLRRINSHIEIAVRDTGIGISPEFLPYVFDRFRQQESTSTRAHGGLGLGLAIVRHLVELHGGTVHADSAGRDQGATFTITLPVMAGVEATAAREHITTVGGVAAGDVPSIDGVRVLVVDDELSARQIVTAILTRGGADVQVAASAEEAMQSIEIRQPDVLVADIEMPGEDGYSLIRRVRRLDAASGGQIPAVALTAYARVQDRLRALSAGYQIHVPKPVEPVELLTVVASLTGRLRQTR
jgi:CheY-like chemotaxis protein/two-component sensor histidine kinase